MRKYKIEMRSKDVAGQFMETWSLDNMIGNAMFKGKRVERAAE